ncbi:MAG: NADAR family protein [Chloroflexia bacterium]|nr:NADAR family protein [Chloroflexia bacterium]
MKYSIQQLLEDINQGARPKFLFFWGHQPQKNGKIGPSCLSQWWISSFKDKNHEYCCTEQYMMAEKARLFDDIETQNEILKSDSPGKIKALGRKVSNFNEEEWIKNRYSIVRQANVLKFSQNADLKEFLLSSGDKVIVEASPVDSIWGIGLAKDHPDAEFPEKWKGLNLLGFALMEVRNLLESANN